MEFQAGGSSFLRQQHLSQVVQEGTRVTDPEGEERRFRIGNECEQSPGLKAQEPSKGAGPKRPEKNRRLRIS